MVKNSFKIFIATFSNVWKILLYKFIIILVALGLIAGLVLPIVVTVMNAISGTGIFEDMKSLISAFFTQDEGFNEIVTSLKSSIEASSVTFASYAARLTTTFIIFFIIVLFAQVLSSLSKLTVSDVVNAEMSSNAKYGFISRFIINIGKSLKISLVSIFTVLPSMIIIITIVWWVFSFLFNYIAVFAVFFALIALIILYSFLQTFFSAYLPLIVVKNTGVFESIGMSVKLISKKFLKVFSNYVVLNIVILFLNITVSFFTCGVGLLISLPATVLFYTCYQMVVFYEISGLKYYAGSNKNIIDPKNSSRESF